MSTIAETTQEHMLGFWQKQMYYEVLTHLGRGDAADYFNERDSKYGTTSLRVPVVVKPQTVDHAAAPAPSTYSELVECFDIVHRISQMLKGTYQPGTSDMGCWKPQYD
jgi:hypothetical protein